MNDCFYFIQMELFKPCSLITKCITSISLMIIAISICICCYQMSEAKINSGLVLYINASLCKNNTCDYKIDGMIGLRDMFATNNIIA